MITSVNKVIASYFGVLSLYAKLTKIKGLLLLWCMMAKEIVAYIYMQSKGRELAEFIHPKCLWN